MKARPWDEIEERFRFSRGGMHAENLGSLITHIRKSGLSNRLFAVASMDKLIVSIYNPLEWNRESLHISFDVGKAEWHFEYRSMPFRSAEFVRNYPWELGAEKFDQFIELIGW